MFLQLKPVSVGIQKQLVHLPCEISRLSKFILDRGAEVEATLTSKHRNSPLTQGGLEIPWIVKVAIPGTLLNKKLLERYEEMVKDLYVEPQEIAIMGSFFENVVMEYEPGRSETRQPKSRNKKKECTQEKEASRAIRTVFSPVVRRDQQNQKRLLLI